MTVASAGLPDSVRLLILSWGWKVSDTSADVIFTQVEGKIEIRAAATLHPDDVAFPPLNKEELEYRIHAVKARRARLAKRLHDLRSPLNAIHGYAEILAETSEGDALRFASNIRTASETMIARLESIRDHGV
ncbi:MAG: hypothetical protein HYX27_11880 [Acidobacteria bacterium]|nr:hypothetical protein [Acidobacteriota bacterium]